MLFGPNVYDFTIAIKFPNVEGNCYFYNDIYFSVLFRKVLGFFFKFQHLHVFLN